MKELTNIPCGYYLFTLALVVFHVVRGFMGQTYLNKEIRRSSEKASCRNIIIFYLHDTLLHIACTVFGAVCLYLAYCIGVNAKSLIEIKEGAAILFVALGVLGLAGITGQLAVILSIGKLPWLQ
jgi:glutaminase